jgi:hypothetical protein
MLVGGVVVHHQMDIQLRRHIGLDVFQELQKLLMAVTRLTPGQYLARDQVQGGKDACATKGTFRAECKKGEPMALLFCVVRGAHPTFQGDPNGRPCKGLREKLEV